MPESIIIKRHYIPAKLIPNLVDICQSVGFDPLIHTGVEFGDYCYFRPDQFDKETRKYLEQRRSLTSEPWVAVQAFGPLKLHAFAYAKVFGSKEAMLTIQSGAFDLGLTATVIRDPLRLGYAGVVITEGQASKGGALRDHRKRVEEGLVAVAAGDDMNDLSMLEEADVAIAMGGAPDPLLAVADIKAPPADKLGIIEGLKEALK